MTEKKKYEKPSAHDLGSSSGARGEGLSCISGPSYGEGCFNGDTNSTQCYNGPGNTSDYCNTGSTVGGFPPGDTCSFGPNALYECGVGSYAGSVDCRSGMTATT